MRSYLISLLVVLAGCSARIPVPGHVGIAFKATTRIDARVDARVAVQPPPAPVIVSIQNAPVVEFFGIPLDGAQDVVFVLDCSGSMAQLARGRMAEIGVASASAPPADASTATSQGGVVVDGPSPSDPQPPGPADGAPPPAEAQPPVIAAAPAQPRKIDVARAELVDALHRLPVGTRMNVLFFNSDLDAFAPVMVVLAEPSRAELITYVQEASPDGRTALAPAMRTAFMMNASRIVLLSDGLGNVGGNAEAVLRDAREAMRGGVRIDTIGVGAGQDGSLLGALAGESGGLYQAL